MYDVADSPNGVRFLKVAVVYLVLGILLGIGMSITHDFRLMPLHAHLGLLGWASLGLAGVIYVLFPRASESRLGYVHFWLHNVGLAIMMVALYFLLSGVNAVEPVLAVGSFLVLGGVLCLGANVFMHVGGVRAV